MAVSLLLCRLPFEQDVEQGNVAHLGDCDGKRSEHVSECVCLPISVQANSLHCLCPGAHITRVPFGRTIQWHRDRVSVYTVGGRGVWGKKPTNKH